MKSIVEDYVPIEEIRVPDHYFKIEIPSWEEVAAPFLDAMAKNHFNDATATGERLTDEVVASMNLEGFTTVNQLKHYAMSMFETSQKRDKFYFNLLPYLVLFYAETSQTIINSEEHAEFVEQFIQRLHDGSEEAGLTFEEFVVQQLSIQAETTDTLMQEIKERASEDFIYKIIATHRYLESGNGLSPEDYEAFVMHNVLTQNLDEIDVRERYSYETFKTTFPEVAFTQELFDYFTPKMTVVIATHE